MRVGLGFDAHAFSDDPARPLLLGGVRIEGERGLAGHSDADVAAHAVADALLGAAGLGDLGQHFPDTDPAWAGADSIDLLGRVAALVAEALLGAAGLGDLGQHFPDTDARRKGVDSMILLAEVVRMVGDGGWTVGNVDCSVVLEAPRLSPRRPTMEQRLSEVVGAPVTVKPRRAEGLGALGRGEGVACWAVAVVER